MLLTSTQPDDLCFLFVQLQTIAGHPVMDLRDALRQTIHRIRMVCGWRLMYSSSPYQKPYSYPKKHRLTAVMFNMQVKTNRATYRLSLGYAAYVLLK